MVHTIRSVNELLQDLAVRHAVQLTRLRETDAKRIGAELRRNMRLIMRRTAASEMGEDFLGTPEYKKLLRSVNKTMDVALQKAYTANRKDLYGLARSESKFAVQSIQNLSPISLGMNSPATALLRAAVDSSPFNGLILKEHWQKLGLAQRTAYKEALNIGLTLGESNNQIARRVGQQLGIKTRQAEAIVRTATTHVSSKARETAYAENTDVVKGVRYLATLDNKTTFTCASLDGRIFKINEGPRPPMHFQCRSTTTPVLKSWKELGIDLKNPPKMTRAARNYRGDLKQAFRAEVPAVQTFGTWLRGQKKHVQIEVLGPKRTELFRKHKLKMDKFVDKNFQPLTLKQLEAQLRRDGILSKVA